MTKEKKLNEIGGKRNIAIILSFILMFTGVFGLIPGTDKAYAAVAVEWVIDKVNYWDNGNPKSIESHDKAQTETFSHGRTQNFYTTGRPKNETETIEYLNASKQALSFQNIYHSYDEDVSGGAIQYTNEKTTYARGADGEITRITETGSEMYYFSPGKPDETYTYTRIYAGSYYEENLISLTSKREYYDEKTGVKTNSFNRKITNVKNVWGIVIRYTNITAETNWDAKTKVQVSYSTNTSNVYYNAKNIPIKGTEVSSETNWDAKTKVKVSYSTTTENTSYDATGNAIKVTTVNSSTYWDKKTKYKNSSSISTNTTYYNITGDAITSSLNITTYVYYAAANGKKYSQSVYNGNTKYVYAADSENIESSSQKDTYYKKDGITKTREVTFKDGVITSEKFFNTTPTPKKAKKSVKIKKKKGVIKVKKWSKKIVTAIKSSNKKVKAKYSVGKITIKSKAKKGTKVKLSFTVGDKNFPASGKKYTYTVTIK
ncbi:MAG: hypothetical protein LBD41_08100 [Clostridiales Family XIII bacterium]|jgi:hypothetical protein|nr:hypothetical protein [Clostridiales Family XIII bacterium]